MHKKFVSTMAFSTSIFLVFTSEIAHSTSLVKIAGTLDEVSQNTPICYVKLPNGDVRDLTKFCGFIKPQSCTGSLGSASRDRVLTEFCKQNEKCLLTNTCNTQPIAPYGPRPGEAAG